MTPIELRSEYEKRQPAWFEEVRTLYGETPFTEIAAFVDGDAAFRNSLRSRLNEISIWNLHQWEWDLLHGKARDPSGLALASRCLADNFLMCIPIYDRFPKNLQYTPMDRMGWGLAQTISVGWKDRGELVARCAFDQIERVLNHGITGHRFPYFLLELTKSWLAADKVDLHSDWRKDRIPDLGFWEKLLVGWREPNPVSFAKLLQETADFHVTESRDLIEDGDRVEQFEVEPGQYWLFPVLIFAVLRLREWEGLPNPATKHALFETSPLGQMPPTLTYPKHDLLDAFETKYRKMFPTFPTTADLPELRRKQGGVTLQ